jgi:hypothetical protein
MMEERPFGSQDPRKNLKRNSSPCGASCTQARKGAERVLHNDDFAWVGVFWAQE